MLVRVILKQDFISLKPLEHPNIYFNVFERHMQSNAQEIINNGWQTLVSLYIFPNSYTPQQKQQNKSKTKRCHLYKNFGKENSESGSGKKNVATKHSREVRHGVFQIGKSGVKNSCLALALLVGKSFLQKDHIYGQLEKNRNLQLTKLYTDCEIIDIYERCDLKAGAVRVDQLHLFYEKHLKSFEIDLVVFSKLQYDTIVYDSRLNSNNQLERITNNVIFLWLNDGHYDLILSPYTFSKCNSSKFCFAYMRYFRRGENKTTHFCKTGNTCHRCYFSDRNCPPEDNFKQQCSECHVLFYNRNCFYNHLTQIIFKLSHGNMQSTCQQFFFCLTCYKTVLRKTAISVNKKTKHKCDETFCMHCNSMKKKITIVL
jgi:hypothetical protein